MLKLQLKKLTFATLLLLGGCLSAPNETFQEQLKFDTRYDVPFKQLETVLVNRQYDSAHHIGAQLPVTPGQAISNWASENIATNILLEDTLRIVVHQADMTQKLEPSTCCASMDKEKDTLDYDLEVITLKDKNVQNRFPVKGQAFVTFDRDMTLSKKERERAKLVRKMINHLAESIATNIDHVVEIPSNLD